jgi:hypothetical protein
LWQLILAHLSQNFLYHLPIRTFLGHFYKMGVYLGKMAIFKERKHTASNALAFSVAIVAMALVLTPAMGSMIKSASAAAPAKLPTGGQNPQPLANTAQKSVTINIRAGGKANAQNAVQNAVLHISIDSQAATENGKIIRFEGNNSTGFAVLRQGGGASPTTFDLSKITLMANGTKITISAAFTDQNDDQGTISANLYAAKNVTNSNAGFISLTNNANSVRLDYTDVNQHFAATGLKVRASADFT